MSMDSIIETAVAELVTQPELFSARNGDVAHIADDAPLVQAARTTRRPVTGARVAKNEARCLVIAAMKCQGFSDRKIAAAVGCDPRSIQRVIEFLEAAGVVPAIKDRLARKSAYLAESTADSVQDLVNEGKIHRDVAATIKALSVTYGIAVEKALLLMGQATEIRANVRPGDVVTDDELRAWMKGSMAAQSGAAADSKSGVLPAITAEIVDSDTLPTLSPTETEPAPGVPANGGEGVEIGGGAERVVSSGSPRNFGHSADDHNATPDA